MRLSLSAGDVFEVFAWFISLMRVVRSVIVVGGLAALGYLAYRYFTKQQVAVPTQLA